MKKLVLTLTILAGFVMHASAYDFQFGNLLYTIISTDPPCVRLDGHVDGTAAQGELIIPETVTYDGIDYNVTKIANSAFLSCIKLEGELVIPNTVTIIGTNAFYHCYRITSVVFGNALEEIQERAFYECLGLRQISDFPESLTELGESAFESCLSLTGTVVIPPQITTIKKWTFSTCNITSVVFPEGLTTIEDDAFISSSLTSLHIPASCTSIGAYAFVDTKLENITVDEVNPVYDSRDDCNALIETSTNTLITGCFNTIFPNSIVTIGEGAFINCDRLKSIDIPEGVTTIKDKVFWDCDSLATVVLPASLHSIGKTAFLCSGVTSSITSKAVVPPTAIYDSYDYSNNSFGGMNRDIPVHIPFGTSQAYSQAPGWNYFTNFIEEAPILYTDFEPDTCKFITDNHESDFMFDIDQDSIVDMTLFGYTQHGAVLVTIDMSNGFEICRSNENTILNADTILWWQSDDLSNGFPLDSYRKRFGFRKTVNEQYYYGWMEIYWDGIFYPEGKMICVDRIAFCTIPDYPLTWGQTHIQEGVEENGPLTGSGALVVYPNPANGVLFVETHDRAPLPNQTYRITNMMGQTLLQGTITGETQQINIESLPSGIYFIIVGGQTMKFMVR